MVDERDSLAAGINLPFRFERRPMPIAAELRPDWKMATLLLILELSSHAGKSSLKRLHILNWAVRSPKHREEFEQVRDQLSPLFGFQFRFEPALARAIDLAVGDDLVVWVGGDRLQITAKGKRWIKQILKDESLLRNERDFLSRMGKTITESMASEMIALK
ncbi:MAG: hypothetical protein ACRD2L_15380, partial [Terriglobia bacterium]